MKPLAMMVVVVSTIVAAGCGQADVVSSDPSAAPSLSTSSVSSTATAAPAPSGSDSPDGAGASQSDLATEVREGAIALEPALDLDSLRDALSTPVAAPTSVTIDRLGLNGTTVVSVGVEPNGEMTIPPPRDVGWYRLGPRPGEPGSAVLAGHIASQGIDGAFRHLDRLGEGDEIWVAFDDGTSLRFVVSHTFQVDKDELPIDDLFARSGPPRVALITCGGSFDYDARSYEDNVVVVADLVTA